MDKIPPERLFSKNLIFVDTEFSTLDPYKGEILSIGLVKLNGEELYLELEYGGDVSDFVEKHILPTLSKNKVSREDAKTKIREFVGDEEPYMVGLINQYDTLYFYKLFGVSEQPLYWIPIDFASILFAEGYNPEKYLKFAKSLGINTNGYPPHHALYDAKLLREVFMKFFEINPEL